MAAEIVICSLPDRTQDLSGRLFGNWTVLAFSHVRVYTTNQNRQRYWGCRCDCGKYSAVQHFELIKGLTLSCGCRRTGCSSTHGLSGEFTGSPIYRAWIELRARCRNDPNYRDRGITYDPIWNDFKVFHDDMIASWKPGLSLDRENNDGPYSKSNCRWADRITQMNNRRGCVYIEHNALTLTVSQWARKLGIHPCTMAERLKSDWPRDKIFANQTFSRRTSRLFPTITSSALCA